MFVYTDYCLLFDVAFGASLPNEPETRDAIDKSGGNKMCSFFNTRHSSVEH